jgi:ADP-ribose pyrophosphatase
MGFFEKPIERKKLYSGRIVDVRLDTAELQNGKRVFREVVEHPGGVAIVPVLDDMRVLLVRQYRYPMGQELLEIPAGKLERGEEPIDCAMRELSEETGYTAGKLTYLGATYPSPGFCEEILHIYLATELTPGVSHPDEDEFLEIVEYRLDELVDMILKNDLPDSKTILGVLKAEKLLFRDRT